MGLGRAAWIGGVVTRRSSWPGTGTSVGPLRTTLNEYRGRGARRAQRTAGLHLHRRSDWPLFAAASRNATGTNILGHIASMEEPSTLVSIRPKRVLRCEKPSRQGQMKTEKFTRSTCMGDEFKMQQLAEAAARWTPAAVAPHLVLARRWGTIA